MDRRHHYHHHHPRSCIPFPSRGTQAMVSLLLFLVMLSTVESSDIECLKSIKYSLQDPQEKLSNWVFNNSTKTYICSFHGVECWFDSDPSPKVLNIKLSDLGLRGEFPQGVSICTSLVGLDLSRNHLYGSIPSNISRLLTYVTSLDLSHNTFSGEIPDEIGNCSFLNVLNLNNNLLTGRIPTSLASIRRLKSLTVANNLLSGPLPEFFYASFPSESYENNAGLCGYPLDPCSRNFPSAFVGGFFAGWAISFTFVVVAMFTPFLEHSIKFVKRKLMATPRSQSLTLSQSVDNTMVSMLEKFATRMSFLELKQATNNFCEDSILAIGEKGTTIYKAVLSNGWCLAIKRFYGDSLNEHEFLSEIMTLGRLRHRNLVPLLGFCLEFNEWFLIYKLMPKGSLHDCLFASKGKTKTTEWPVKAKIAVGIAQGITWLHLNRVVHCGISSKCILLDDDFTPRITGFGKAMNLKENSDLYEEDVKDFGKVMLELIIERKYDDIVSSFDMNADMFGQIFKGGGKEEQGFDDESSRFLKVACVCLQCDPCNRLSMEEVCQMLTGKTRNRSISLKSEIEFAD